MPLIDSSFKHKTRQTIFALCGNDFDEKYHLEDDLHHLQSISAEHYDISLDKDGTNHYGLPLNGIINKAVSMYSCQNMWQKW